MAALLKFALAALALLAISIVYLLARAGRATGITGLWQTAGKKGFQEIEFFEDGTCLFNGYRSRFTMDTYSIALLNDSEEVTQRFVYTLKGKNLILRDEDLIIHFNQVRSRRAVPAYSSLGSGAVLNSQPA